MQFRRIIAGGVSASNLNALAPALARRTPALPGCREWSAVTRSIKLAILSAVLVLGAVPDVVAAGTDPLSKANRLPASLEQTVQDFQKEVIGKGYQVSRGYWRLWSVDDCKLPLQTVGFCYGNNPVAPYVLAFVPPWKDEFVDQSLHHALAEGQRNMVANYRLGEREALVVFAELPPKARYFGYGTNVFTRQAELNEQDSVYQRLKDDPAVKDLLGIIFGPSPNPARMMMIATVGDTINNVVIEDQSTASWAEQRFFVTTADAAMEVVIKSAFKEAGVDLNNVFTERVSPFLVSLGYKPEADDFMTYIRYSMPDDVTLGNQWREKLPLTILRVRDMKKDTAEDAFAVPQYESKSKNYDEPLNLTDDLKNLVAAVKEYWQQDGADDRPDAQVLEFKSLTLWIDLVGQHCLGYKGPPATDGIALPRGPMNCLGDNQDDEPHISAGTYRLDEGQVIAVVGTLSTETGNATYTSLSVNWFPELVGVANRDDPELAGSAKQFSTPLTHPHDMFYVYYFARDCSGLANCYEIPRTLVPKGDTIKFVQRNYINPESRRAPDPHMILAPVAIEFTRGNGKRPPK